ncbi:uncharacterized protein LOC134714039 [Mytilus trossulus]|uniref:uncharacterized protein LOC134714039 n=1 Tax=Mytilus trossulus TaxID=6551 RepID=UPI0030048EFE
MATDARNGFLDQIKSTIDYCVRVGSAESIELSTRKNIQDRLKILKNGVRRGGEHLSDNEIVMILASITELGETLDQVEANDEDDTSNKGYRPPKQESRKGSPAFEITAGQLQFLTKYGISASKIAETFHVSESTIRRRLRSFNIKLREGKYDSISDEELCEKVKDTIGTNRKIGPNSILQRLKYNGITVQRRRVRQACNSVDPFGCATRSLSRRNIQRRTYRVPSPNSLWHIDGNHKLVRWGIYIHGAIDGFSRVVTFLYASTNNKSATVLSLFKQAVSEYGVPSPLAFVLTRVWKTKMYASLWRNTEGVTEAVRSRAKVAIMCALRDIGSKSGIML